MKTTVKSYYESKPKQDAIWHKRYLKYSEDISIYNDKHQLTNTKYTEFTITYDDAQYIDSIHHLWFKKEFWTQEETERIVKAYREKHGS